MRFQYALSAILFCLFSTLLPCVASGEDEIIDACMGKWKVNLEETVKLLKDQGLPEDSRVRLTERIADFSLELTKDKRFTLRRPDGEKMQGKWKVESEDKEKNEVKLTLTPDSGEEPVTLAVSLLEMNSQLKMAPPNQPAVVFDRQPEKTDDGQDK